MAKGKDTSSGLKLGSKGKWRITFNSPVVLTFVFLSFAVMLLNYATAGKSNEVLFVTYRSSLLHPLTWIRFFTHVLGHSGWEHYINNMMMILITGPMLEEKYGSKAIVQVILVTGFVVGAVSWVFFPSVALCGASGVVFAFILMTSFTSYREGDIPLTVILVAVIFIGQQIYEGMVLQDNVSQMGHILGGFVGATAGYLLNRK